MLSEFFVQACEEISLIAAFGLFLITGVYAFFQWNKGKEGKTLIPNVGLAGDNGYADTSLNDGKSYGSSQPVSNDIFDEKAFLKLELATGLPAKNEGESLSISSMGLTYPEMLTEAIGRRNYSAVGRMADRGLTVVQIANELGIPKGEVNLVLKLKSLYGDGHNMALPLEAALRAAG